MVSRIFPVIAPAGALAADSGPAEAGAAEAAVAAGAEPSVEATGDGAAEGAGADAALEVSCDSGLFLVLSLQPIAAKASTSPPARTRLASRIFIVSLLA